MRLALFLSAALLAATTMAQDLTPTDVLAQLPDFPKHWNQDHLYNQVIRDEYGNSAPAGCVAVAGAACMDWFHYPAKFGEKKYNSTGRELRTETLDWARLAPEPLDARGRRTAQTILYNLGLLTQIHYVQGGSSTTPLVYLAAALKDPSVNYASAYYVEFGSGATPEDVKTAIWASLRCGSPVAMSIERDGGAHAVVATGCGTDVDGNNPLTQVFGGYGSNPTWMDVPTSMPIPGGYTYSRLASVVTGIVPTAPEGISGAALPVLGTVVDANNNPIPFAKVTLSINGKVVAETATDLKGRYGLWGWFGHNMTIQASIYTTGTNTASSDPETLLAQQHNGETDYPLPGMPALRVKVADLRNAIEACERKLTIDTDLSGSAPIYTSLDDAKAAAQASEKPILCLNSEDPDLKAAFRRLKFHTLLYADPCLPAPFPEADSLPDVRLFRLDASGSINAYSTTATSNNFTDSLGSLTSTTITGEKAEASSSWNSANIGIKNSSTIKSCFVSVTGDFHLATFTVNDPVTFTGEGTITWANLVQNDPITLSGHNFRYAPTIVGEGEEAGKTSAFPGDFTVQNGAELYFGAGDVSGYEETSGTITIGPKGILCVASRDTLNRPLVLAGGEVHLGDKGGNFGSLDLFSTTIKVTADSSISGLSGANNPQLMVRDGTSTITLSNDARLSVSVPINAADKSKDTLSLSGNGVVDFDTVSAPVIAGSGVLLEGGTFSGGLSLTNGARLSALHSITVTGTLTVSGTVSIEEPRSGVFLHGNANTTVATSAFTAPNGFTVKKVGNDYRLVASSATAPVWYANGVRVKAKPDGATNTNSLLILTTTDRKESGLWEDYAAFRSSPAGGDWNVCIAANGNIPDGKSASDYIQSAGCAYVLIGASVSEIPALADTIDRLANFHIGRLPLRESVSMGTVEDLGSQGSGAKQTYANRIDAELIEAYVAKLRKAGDKHARGKLSLLGGGYGVLDSYKNDTDFTQWDGLPSIEDTEAWTKPTSLGLTVYALRDRYRLFKTAEPDVFPDLTLYDDVTIPLGTAPNGLAYGRGIIGKTDGALLWVEDRGHRNRLSTICVNGTDNGTVTAEVIPGLYSLVVTPSGQSGDFSQADSPSVSEMLVLNPQGGALTVLAPTGTDATLTVSDTGIPSSDTHTVCAAVAETLIENPTLTVGQAFSQALEANPNRSTTLTLLGDPSVRIMAWPEPKPILSEEVTLSEETLNALRAAAEAAGLFKDYEVVVSGLDGAKRPIAELDDALACFEGLEPTVEGDKVVVAYDFGVTGLRIEGTTVFVTLSVRGKGQSLTFTEGNDYAIAPQSLDGTQPLAAPPTVTPSTPTDDGTVELRFPLPEGDSTFLFRATVSRPTP